MRKIRELFSQPLCWTAFAAVVFAVLLGGLAIQRHYNLESCEDLAMFDQMLWNLRNGFGLITTLSGEADLLFRHHFFGEHVAPILYLFAWPAGLTRGPEALLIIQALVFSLSAFPLARWAGRSLRNDWAGTAAAIFWLGMPNLWLAVFYDWHMEAAEPFFIFAFVLTLQSGSRWVWFWALLYAACKEDAPIYLAFVSVIFGWRSRRALGFKIAVCAVIYALLAWLVIGPACSASGSHQLISRVLTPFNCHGWRPWIAAVFFSGERWAALMRHLSAFGFLPLLGGFAILPAAAAVGANWLSISPFQYLMTMHYPFTVYPLLMLSAIWGVGYFLDRLDIYFNVSGKVGRGVPALTCGECNRTSEAEGPAEPSESWMPRRGIPTLTYRNFKTGRDGSCYSAKSAKAAFATKHEPSRPILKSRMPRRGIPTLRLKIFYAAVLIAASIGLISSWMLSADAVRERLGTGGKDWKNTSATLAGLPKDGKWAALLQLVSHCARRDDVTVLMAPQHADWLVVRLHGRAYTFPENEYRRWLADLLSSNSSYGVYCRPNNTVAVLRKFHSRSDNAEALSELLWVIEEDDVEHKIGSARMDAEALNGRAWTAGGNDCGPVWYGAYRDLPPGRYLARFRVKTEAQAETPLARLEVAEECGKHVRGALDVSGPTEGYVWKTLEVNLEGVGGAECRLFKTGRGTIAIDRVELKPIGEQ